MKLSDLTNEELISKIVYTVESVSNVNESNYYAELREELLNRLQNTSANSDYAKCKAAYINGYESGHNDTVESCYGSSDEKADEWVSGHFA
jgi:hypothetical protein